MSALGRAPLWIRCAAALIRRLPAGRYRAMNRVGARASRFVATLPRELGGYLFDCDLRDSISREACFTGRYEPLETAVVRWLLAPGATFVDVGANWGYFTLVAAAIAGERGRVVAFEPDPRLFAKLEANVAMNALARVTALRIAAAAESARVKLVGFDERDGNFGLSRIAPASASGDRSFEVDAKPIDLALDELQVGDVDLLKMDIEGAEDLALRGMESGLARRRYRRVLLELHPALLEARGERVDDVIARLERHRYRAAWLDHSPASASRAAYARRLAPRDFIVARRPERLDAWPHALWLAPGVELEP